MCVSYSHYFNYSLCVMYGTLSDHAGFLYNLLINCYHFIPVFVSKKTQLDLLYRSIPPYQLSHVVHWILPITGLSGSPVRLSSPQPPTAAILDSRYRVQRVGSV